MPLHRERQVTNPKAKISASFQVASEPGIRGVVSARRYHEVPAFVSLLASTRFELQRAPVGMMNTDPHRRIPGRLI